MSKKRKFLLPSEPVPEDIHWEWLEVIKALQAACKDNEGYAHLSLRVSVHRNKPILWAPAVTEPMRPEEPTLPRYHLLKLSPKRVADYQLSSSTVASLMALHQES